MKRKNFHYFEIKGLNQERFFNNLSKKYEIFEINRLEKNRTQFKVKYFDGKKVKKELLNAGFEILDEKECGIYKFLFNAVTSYGIIAALLICLMAYFIQYPFVQKIEVWGDYDHQAIENFVWQNMPSRNKNKLDLNKLERMINSEFDNLSFVSAAFVGQSLIINVKKEIVPPEMEGEFPPLISEYDGVVTQIKLIQGTPLVSVGDIIQKGQTLVEGYVINSEGEKLNLQPRAEIYMDVWLQAEQTHFARQMITQRTGRKAERTEVSLFQKVFYSNGVKNPFSQSEEEISTKKLTKNNILPFILTKITYFETKTTIIESTFEEKREQTIALAREKCLQNLKESEIIKKEDYLILEGAGFTTVRYVVTVNLLVTGENESLQQQT